MIIFTHWTHRHRLGVYFFDCYFCFEYNISFLKRVSVHAMFSLGYTRTRHYFRCFIFKDKDNKKNNKMTKVISIWWYCWRADCNIRTMSHSTAGVRVDAIPVFIDPYDMRAYIPTSGSLEKAIVVYFTNYELRSSHSLLNLCYCLRIVVTIK